LNTGDYYGLVVTRTDGTSYIAYFRVMQSHTAYGLVVFKDDTGAIVSMQPKFTEAMFPVKPEDCPKEINLEDFRPDALL
jgi:hypothetical protein